jgi:SAM-dependent methyltransferase
MGSADIQGALWGHAPRDWAELQEPLHRPLWEVMIDAVGVGPGKRVLDAGCGGGGASVLAADRNAQVSGVDAASVLVEVAKSKVPDGDFRVGDLEELPFANDTFDAVIAANSVQYAADPIAALRELKRVTKSGGRIAVGIWGRAENCEFRHILKAVADAMPEPPKGGGPFALSEPGALETLFEKAGLKVDGRTEVDCPFFYPDVDTGWRAAASAGPVQGAMRAAGEAPIKAAVTDAFEQFVQDSGDIQIANTMLFVTAAV